MPDLKQLRQKNDISSCLVRVALSLGSGDETNTCRVAATRACAAQDRKGRILVPKLLLSEKKWRAVVKLDKKE